MAYTCQGAGYVSSKNGVSMLIYRGRLGKRCRGSLGNTEEAASVSKKRQTMQNYIMAVNNTAKG